MLTIKLDTNAVRSLFPEGSDARVELQRAVMANIAKDIGRSVGVDHALMAELQAVAERAGKQAMDDYIAKKGTWLDPQYALTDQIRARVTKLVREQMDGEIRSVVLGELKAIEDKILDRITKQLNEYADHNMSKITETYIQQAVRNRFSAALDQASKGSI